MKGVILDIRDEKGKARDRATVNMTMKLVFAKQYLQERGLTAQPVGRGWSRPYTPPAIDRYGSQLQRALLWHGKTG